MFYCKECRKKNNYPVVSFKSLERCDCCDDYTLCYNAHEKYIEMCKDSPEESPEEDEVIKQVNEIIRLGKLIYKRSSLYSRDGDSRHRYPRNAG